MLSSLLVDRGFASSVRASLSDGKLNPLPPGTLLDEEEFRIDSVVLDHGTPCLAFAFQ
jgi:hypothetical protein